MSNKQKPPMILPAIFAISWLVLGYNSGSHLTGSMKWLGLAVGVLVILSMMVILPFQRKNCIADGPGMPLFVIAWVLIVYMNSNR